MHIQEIATLHFDPKKSDNPDIKKIFSDRTSTILWCSIRVNHITDQYFNGLILEAVKKFNTCRDTRDYHAFLKATYSLNEQFGRVTIEQRLGPSTSVIDHEFWADIFKAIHGQRKFELKESK